METPRDAPTTQENTKITNNFMTKCADVLLKRRMDEIKGVPVMMRVVMTEAPGDWIQEYHDQASSGYSCLNLTRQIGPDKVISRHKRISDWIGPDQVILRHKRNTRISSEDSCLNLTREDWTRPDDLKSPDEHQTGLDQTKLDLKIQQQEMSICRCVLRVSSSPDVPVRLGETCDDRQLLSTPDQMALQTS
ncbi:hypothetical protein Bbelb_189920 [Branchiostoma belcheri]|nr:hypothetical protein Bbelb_189920 [Branchiostoma belcheri]